MNTATVIGGYLYYRHNKVQISKWVQQKEDQMLGAILNLQDKRFEKDTEQHG